MAKEELELVDFYYGMFHSTIPSISSSVLIQLSSVLENKGWELVADAKKTADENVRDLGESFLILNPEARKSTEAPK
jgi:hypothetical protein